MLCNQCGADIPNNSKFCTVCGSKLEEKENTEVIIQQDERNTINQENQFDPADVSQNRIIAILMYIFNILFFLPLVMNGKKTPYLMFHSNNVLIIIIIGLISAILSFSVIIPIILGIFAIILWIMGLIQACTGSSKPMPIIGKLVLLKP